MQETRQHILEILRDAGQATVDEIVDSLCSRRGSDITAVTVRHHLARLQEDGLITDPEMSHRSTPGRPRHIYALTEHAHQYFPNNYHELSAAFVSYLDSSPSNDGVNVILEGVADCLANRACIPDGSLEDRLKHVIKYLNQQGYDAYSEKSADGYVLHTRNCPYHSIAHTTDSLCMMDMRLISALLGVVPRMLSRVAAGDATCAYLIPDN
jgi:predicted ArsR family transcriptional regulator